VVGVDGTGTTDPSPSARAEPVVAVAVRARTDKATAVRDRNTSVILDFVAARPGTVFRGLSTGALGHRASEPGLGTIPTVTTTNEPSRGPSPGAGWRRVTHGIHVASEGDVLAELAAWQLLLPKHGCFTHLTAAAVRGWWLPPLPAGMPVFVSLGQRDPRPLRDGIRSIRLTRPCAFDVVDGLRLATPLEILLACAPDLGLVDLVVLIDGAVFAGDVTLEQLRDDVATLRGRRGLRALRRALVLADDRSESPFETLLRLLHVSCDVEVEPQHEIEGARADLWLVGTRTLHEYDGEVHLPRPQQRKDLRRLRRLDEQRWTRHGYSDDDVLRRAVTILRDADRAVGREHLPERIRPWHDLLRESLFTPAGQARLARRWGAEEAA